MCVSDHLQELKVVEEGCYDNLSFPGLSEYSRSCLHTIPLETPGIDVYQDHQHIFE